MDSQGKFIDIYTTNIRYRGVQKDCGMACFSQMASSIDKWQKTSSIDNPRKMIDFFLLRTLGACVKETYTTVHG